MSEIGQITAAEYLNQRLGLSSDRKISNGISQLGSNSSKNNQGSDKLDLTISASDTSYLVLRDSIDKFASLTSLVQISKNSLSKIGDYLAQIKLKFEQLQNVLPESETSTKINSELKILEDEMSNYISSAIINSTRASINISPIGNEVHQRYYNTVVNEGQFGAVEAKTLASIEINLAHTAIKETVIMTLEVVRFVLLRLLKKSIQRDKPLQIYT